jgi:hypothetical protein
MCDLRNVPPQLSGTPLGGKTSVGNSGNTLWKVWRTITKFKCQQHHRFKHRLKITGKKTCTVDGLEHQEMRDRGGSVI